MPSYQLEKLLVEPLRLAKQDFSSYVVVVDALDECTDDHGVILNALARHIDDLSPLKFFITSRPVDHIIAFFRAPILMKNSRTFSLQEVSPGHARGDIFSYLKTELTLVANLYGVSLPWPPEADLMSLVDQANGLFIFAATALKYIQDGKIKDPEGQLSLLLNPKTSSSIQRPTMYTPLDALYLQVLNTAFPEIEPTLHTQLKTVLGSVVSLYEPLRPSTLDSLLCLQPGSARRVLYSLQANCIQWPR